MLKAFCECQKKCQQTQNASNQLLHPHPFSMLRCLLGVEETVVMVVVVVQYQCCRRLLCTPLNAMHRMHHDPPILGTTLHLVLAMGCLGQKCRPRLPTQMLEACVTSYMISGWRTSVNNDEEACSTDSRGS